MLRPSPVPIRAAKDNSGPSKENLSVAFNFFDGEEIDRPTSKAPLRLLPPRIESS